MIVECKFGGSQNFVELNKLNDLQSLVIIKVDWLHTNSNIRWIDNDWTSPTWSANIFDKLAESKWDKNGSGRAYHCLHYELEDDLFVLSLSAGLFSKGPDVDVLVEPTH